MQQRRHAHHVQQQGLRQLFAGGPAAIVEHGLAQQLAIHASLDPELVRR
jgi:hypothetical protein